MKVYYGVGKINQKFKRPILTIGIFDGVHLGHQSIIRRIVREARRIKGSSIVLTFYPHPYHVLKPSRYLPLLISLEHRLKLLEDLGVDICIVQSFTDKFSKIGKQAFIKNILINKIHPLEIFVGKDFNFGKDKSGGIDLLKKQAKVYGYKLRIIPSRSIGKKKISSTLIRSLIRKGDLKKSSGFLGRPVSILGKIVKGSRRGKILGFPTANIDYEHEVLPPGGVYAVRIILDRKNFSGVANIGLRPSFKRRKSQKKSVLEVHIFNFHKRIYGKKAEVVFVKKIRIEKKFKERKNLIRQINKDIIKTKQILSSNRKKPT